MIRMTQIAASAILLIASHGVGRAEDKFEKVAIYLEQTIEDQDVEVQIDAIGGTTGLATLKVTTPDGRTVIDFNSSGLKLGIRHFTFESPEPKKAEGKLQAEFPEGSYKFAANTVDGRILRGEATLTHELPDPTSLLHPRPDEKNVPLTGLVLRWKPVKDVTGIAVILEQETTAREIKAELSATATAFAVPDGFLTPGTQYKLAIGTVSRHGNKSFVETSFTTAGKK